MKRLNKLNAPFCKRLGRIMAVLIFMSAVLFICCRTAYINIYNPNYTDGFYYKKLNEKQRTAYAKIYKGIVKYNNSVKISPIPESSIKKIFYSIIFDNPELLFVSDKFSYEKDNDGNVVRLCLSYTMSKKRMSEQITAVNETLSEIKEKTSAFSEYEKELYVHDYLLQNCEYTTGKLQNNTIYGALVLGKANCRGYSAAFAYILNNIGVKTTQIIGTAKQNNMEEGHSWNVVILNNEYYYCDVCWDDIDKEVCGKIPYHYAFFNMDYDDISKTHKQDIQEEYLFPVKDTNSGTYSYMKENGLYASNYEEAYDIIMAKLQFAKQSGKPLMVQCKSDLDYLKMGRNIEKIIKKASKEKDLDIVCFKYLAVPNGNTIIIYDVY